jgi:hypothetical protein
VFTPDFFLGGEFFTIALAIVLSLYVLAIAYIVRTLRAPALCADDEKQEAVLLGLNRRGARVFVALALFCWPLCCRGGPLRAGEARIQ